MINRLRKKFILAGILSILIVFSGIFTMVAYFGIKQLNDTMDTLTEAIAENNGVFPKYNVASPPIPSRGFAYTDIITEETPYSTRFFTVWLDRKDQIMMVNVDSVFSVSEVQTGEYVRKVLEDGQEKGWVDDYRYKVFGTPNGHAIVFVNGTMNRLMVHRFLVTTLLVFAASGLIVLILFVFISKHIARPVVESYEKQKQFVTDANHELKTPLTLILSNLDIVESEVGKNEWLDDIRSEGQRMWMLINQLVTLAKMDEEQAQLVTERFDLSSSLLDTISEFQSLAAERQKVLSVDVKASIYYKGDEAMVRRLLAILLDNAVKYCDSGGKIQVLAYEKYHPVIIVENTCCNVEQMELDKLFDRFYRVDKARTFSGSFGIGLSIAKGIAQKHHGDINVYKKEQVIGFRVDLK